MSSKIKSLIFALLLLIPTAASADSVGVVQSVNDLDVQTALQLHYQKKMIRRVVVTKYPEGQIVTFLANDQKMACDFDGHTFSDCGPDADDTQYVRPNK
jgi:hypothetical protein